MKALCLLLIDSKLMNIPPPLLPDQAWKTPSEATTRQDTQALGCTVVTAPLQRFLQ